MKRIFSPLLVLALSTAFVPAAHADGECNDATLTGTYSYNYKGWFPTVDKDGHLVLAKSMITDIVGVATFDGAGKFITSLTFCGNGACGPGSDRGTYSVKSDCSGKAKLKTAGANYNLAISKGGSQVYVIETDAGSNVSGTITKQ